MNVSQNVFYNPGEWFHWEVKYWLKIRIGPQCWLQPLSICFTVCKGNDIWQEDHHLYTGGPLIISSVWTRSLRAASTFITLDRRAFCCIITVEVYSSRDELSGCATSGVQRVYPLADCSQRVAEEGIMWGKPHQQKSQQMRSLKKLLSFLAQVNSFLWTSDVDFMFLPYRRMIYIEIFVATKNLFCFLFYFLALKIVPL